MPREQEFQYTPVTKAGKPVSDDTSKIEKIIATLSGQKAGAATKLGKQLAEAVKQRKAIEASESQLKDQTREMLSELFDAADAAWTRVIETGSVIITMSKAVEAGTKLDVEKFIGKLAQAFPVIVEQMAAIRKECESPTSARASSVTVKLKDEGVIGDIIKSAYTKVKEQISKFLEGFKREMDMYDSVLTGLRKEIGNMYKVEAHMKLMSMTNKFMSTYMD